MNPDYTYFISINGIVLAPVFGKLLKIMELALPYVSAKNVNAVRVFNSDTRMVEYDWRVKKSNE